MSTPRLHTISRVEKFYTQFPNATTTQVRKMMREQYGNKSVNGTFIKRAKVNAGLLNPFSKMTQRIEWVVAMLIAQPELTFTQIQVASCSRFRLKRGINLAVIRDQRRYLLKFNSPMSINQAWMIINSNKITEPLHAS